MKYLRIFEVFLVIVMLSIFGACTEPIDIPLDSTFKRLTVYGEITSDTVIQTIRLTKTADYFYNKPAQAVSGAYIRISDGENVIYLEENKENPGVYETIDEFYGIPGKTYTLYIDEVDIDGDQNFESYEAVSEMPVVNPIDSINVSHSSYPFFKGTEILLYARDPAELVNYYAFKVVKNGILQTDSLPEILIQNDLLFNGNYTNGISVQFLNDEKPGEKVEPGDTIIFELYGITEDYYNFILQAQTELFGSNPLFSGPPANISTNLTNGAIGFFTAVSIKRACRIAPEFE
jgi:hypothetical protein